MAAELREVLLNQRNLGQPAFDVDAEQFVHVGTLDVDSPRIEIGDLGNPADCGIRCMHLAVTTLEDPFQHAAVYSKSRPQELAIRILAKPVDVENFWQLRRLRVLTNLEPMPKVVA